MMEMLSGLMLIKPRVHRDDRGWFVETYQRERYRDLGVEFMQDNHSHSTRGTLRGMHFQTKPGQAKLVRCARGEIFDVAVDIRPRSSTFGKWQAVTLDDTHHHQLFIPVGFAHGFLVLSETADVVYKVSSPYVAETETGFHYADPDVGITWPMIGDITVSPRDQGARSLRDVVTEAS